MSLQRFVDAQATVYEQVVVPELKRARKDSHWMWFIFPQLFGLSNSPMSRRYALVSKEEAVAYWQHPVLGSRLKECIELLLAEPNKTAFQILGTPDDLKLRACMTLFMLALPNENIFSAVLMKYYGGIGEQHTINMLTT